VVYTTVQLYMNSRIEAVWWWSGDGDGGGVGVEVVVGLEGTLTSFVPSVLSVPRSPIHRPFPSVLAAVMQG